MSARASDGLFGLRPSSSTLGRSDAVSHSAAASATARSTSSSGSSDSASASAGPSGSASAVPVKMPAEPSEIPLARERSGSAITATLVTALRISGWATATRIWPASAAAKVSEVQAHGAAERGQPRARQQRGAKPAVQGQPGGQREQDVEQREDLREPADRALGDAEMGRGVGRDRRVGEPQQLVRGGDGGVGGDHSPARGHARPRYKAPDERRQGRRSGAGEHTGPTAALAPGYTQANLVVLPEADAFDFLRFCVANPRPCPVLEVCDPGDPEPRNFAPGADLRTDLPRYRIHRDGEVTDEVTDVDATSGATTWSRS